MEYGLQTRLLLILPKCQLHVLDGSAKIHIRDRVSISTENPRRTNSSQGARAVSKSSVATSPSCAAEQRQRIIVPFSTRLCLRGSDYRSDFLSFKPRQEDDEQQECVQLLIASFMNPLVQTEPLSDTSVCRQFHHRRLRLLEFPLQMMILPHVSADSSART